MGVFLISKAFIAYYRKDVNMKLASFDIEIAKDLGDNIDNWIDHVPLGITCGAVAFSDQPEIKYWQAPEQLGKEESIAMVRDLQSIVGEGYSLLTWNGAGFDFQVLAHESGMFEECGELALNHIDMMLLVTFDKGWYLSLQTALEGPGLAGKLKTVKLKDGTLITDMAGAQAPKLWAAGEYEAVLAYLKQDVLQPLELAENIEKTGSIRWTSNNGRPQTVKTELKTVRECFAIPEPDTSWMKDPPQREQFVSWIPDFRSKIMNP